MENPGKSQGLLAAFFLFPEGALPRQAKPRDVSPPEELRRRIEVRAALPEDLAWVRDLAIRSVIHGIPDSRDVPSSQVQERAREAALDLVGTFGADPDLRILVAVEARSGELLGYLVLELGHREASTGEPQALIRDLAVEPRAWGSRAVHHLVREAARLTFRHGLRYLIGEVTAANRRPLVVAQRMGFVIERHQIAVQCGPEGLLPMPGRPATVPEAPETEPPPE